MLRYTVALSSSAEEFEPASFKFDALEVTHTDRMDEQSLYNTLNARLIVLETSLNLDINELQSIRGEVGEFHIQLADKEELSQRVDWLQRLYQAKNTISSVATKDELQRLRNLLNPVQTCPLKKQLMVELSELEYSLSEGDANRSETSNEELLMEQAFEEAGDSFINLGQAGREFVISNVIKQFEDNASIENVKDGTTSLEQRVSNLANVTSRNEMLDNLEQLPLKSFNDLTAARKEAIAYHLIENNKWNGLAALNRQIVRINKSITKEEQDKEKSQNTVLTDDGQAAYTLSANDEENNLFYMD